MKINLLGAQGGVTQTSNATSVLINGTILFDAGSVATALPINDQVKIDTIFVSHSHLDHTKDLAFICDNCFGMRDRPFEVYASEETTNAIKDHLFNDIIWPDFSKLPNAKNPIIKFNIMKAGDIIKANGCEIRACHVNHIPGSLGFIIDDGKSSAVFTFDTCATEEIWKVAHEYKNLKAIFSEISFPNNLKSIADASFHHTPNSFNKELDKMPKDIPVYILHLKPQMLEQLKDEISALKNTRLKAIDEDQVFIEI